ncbi:protein of unknown function DUF558 [Acidimicrobium ferrooxidans DSM 10331]|uniref:Ribosomal RNA small subunit methyltransferase E n=1 Tax=Acidimicrobium ferrooxidans (strain DSM 10331 / JCM 15462 / NBRC 103882 / ICP) TaxID=525909 RepID=C7LZR4_ACIFD|nr:16S rRNA (uracil(1498)-N(3))-methyltransferase [Acidimicrobium ferrooxidans]ACU54222.1 protein of unknown function DUF558 [Acidimicrobium ferrooxidans DSM 10331]
MGRDANGATGRLEPFFIVDDLEAPVVDDALAAHLRARRLGPRASIWIGDGRGRVRAATLAEVGRRTARIEACGEIVAQPRRTPEVSIASYAPSRERLAWMVAKLAELGIADLWLLRAPHDRRGGEPLSAHELGRLERIAREAAQQAEVPWVVRIHDVGTLDELPRDGVVVADPAGGGLVGRDVRCIVIGPESGRIDGLADVRRVRLPGGILRVETAAVVAGALLVALGGNIVDPACAGGYA